MLTETVEPLVSDRTWLAGRAVGRRLLARGAGHAREAIGAVVTGAPLRTAEAFFGASSSVGLRARFARAARNSTEMVDSFPCGSVVPSELACEIDGLWEQRALVQRRKKDVSTVPVPGRAGIIDVCRLIDSQSKADNSVRARKDGADGERAHFARRQRAKLSWKG